MPKITATDLQWQKNRDFCIWLDSEGRDVNGDPPDRTTIALMFQAWKEGHERYQRCLDAQINSLLSPPR